jgi:hypothetical protein
MLRKQLIKLFLLLIVFSSCEYPTGTGQKTINENRMSTDDSKKTFLNSIADKGFTLFKNNCAICHCSIHGTCEVHSGFRFQKIFNALPVDSLNSYMKFVKNSKTSGLNYTAKSEHTFEKKLTDKEIEIIIEYLWLQCQMKK